MAQLVARFHGMEEVRGSNPLSSTASEFSPLSELRWAGEIFLVKTIETIPAWVSIILEGEGPSLSVLT